MTTTVKKGTLRPAAEIQGTKAAQRTPLPGDTRAEFERLCALPLAEQARPAIQRRIRALANKFENTAAGVEARKLPGNSIPLEAQTVRFLRELAQSLGLSSTTRITRKAELIAAIEKARPAATPRQPRQMGSLAQEAAKAPDTGRRKAEEFTAIVATYGWATKTTKAGASVKVVAKRGTEVLTVAWTSGCYDYEASSYARGDRSRKVLNVSAARQIAARPGLEVVQ